MYVADYHTHSRISPDGSASMAQMAQAAVDAGLHEICFTDHIEPITWAGQPRDTYDWEALWNEFAQAQQAWGDQIQLRLGMELGEALMSFSRTEKMCATMPKLDFVIGSVHRLGPQYGYEDLFTFTPQTQAQGNEALEDYLTMVEALVNWGQFSVLGHLTLPLRYFNEYRGGHYSFDPFKDHLAHILKQTIDKGLGIELNVNRGGMPLPHDTWLKLYRDLGGQRITIGSDAHSPAQVGQGILAGQALLKDCGFTRFCTFNQGEAHWHLL